MRSCSWSHCTIYSTIFSFRILLRCCTWTGYISLIHVSFSAGEAISNKMGFPSVLIMQILPLCTCVKLTALVLQFGWFFYYIFQAFTGVQWASQNKGIKWILFEDIEYVLFLLIVCIVKALMSSHLAQDPTALGTEEMQNEDRPCPPKVCNLRMILNWGLTKSSHSAPKVLYNQN